MARKRTGTIQKHGKYLAARHYVTIDGVTTRRWYNFGTTSWALARAKNRELLAKLERGEVPDVESTAQLELCSEAFTRLCEKMRDDGLVTWKRKLARLRRYAGPLLGNMRIDEVRAVHMREAIDRMKAAGNKKQSCSQLLFNLRSIFAVLVEEELIEKNPALLCKLPAFHNEDGRQRAILTDAEIGQFANCEEVPLWIRIMAVVSRCLGGMRASDLHALDWTHFDLVGWATAEVYRPKTQKTTLLEIPAELVPWLQRWHLENGSPTEGPVFPANARSKNPGGRRGYLCYSRTLRLYLRRAGITRPELFEDGKRTRKVDFHSFRRAYVTALAKSGINAQLSMKLASHSKLETHLLYFDRQNALQTPQNAVPALGPSSGPNGSGPPRVEPYLAAAGARAAAAVNVPDSQKVETIRLFRVKAAGSTRDGNRLISLLLSSVGPYAWTKALVADEPATAAE